MCSFIFLLSEFSYAQVSRIAAKFREIDILSFKQISWTEKMLIQDNLTVEEDIANFTGQQIEFEKSFSDQKWGWGLAASLGFGKASGGGNAANIIFQKGNTRWSSLGLSAQIYSKISPRFYVGLRMPVRYKNIGWPVSDSSLSVSSGKTISAGVLFESTFRLNAEFDFTQAIGFYSASEGSTLWQIGLGYRL